MHRVFWSAVIAGLATFVSVLVSGAMWVAYQLYEERRRPPMDEPRERVRLVRDEERPDFDGFRVDGEKTPAVLPRERQL